MEQAHADDYVVRLAPRARPPIDLAAPHAPARQRSFPVRLFIVAVVAMVALGYRATIVEWATTAIEGAQKPVRALQGEQQMDAAASALIRLWETDRTFAVSAARLEEVDSGVNWGEVIRFQSCLSGRGAVITADTAKGTRSQLILLGSDRGTVNGDPGCPASVARIAPWGGLW